MTIFVCFWKSSYLNERLRPREHCFIGWNCFCTSKELIHYNFSAEWAIQSFMLALCMLFTDGTYEAHLATYNIFPNGSQRGTLWKLRHKQHRLRELISKFQYFSFRRRKKLGGKSLTCLKFFTSLAKSVLSIETG